MILRAKRLVDELDRVLKLIGPGVDLHPVRQYIEDCQKDGVCHDEVDHYTKLYGEHYRPLISKFLEFLNENEKRWGAFSNRDEQIRQLLSK